MLFYWFCFFKESRTWHILNGYLGLTGGSLSLFTQGCAVFSFQGVFWSTIPSSYIWKVGQIILRSELGFQRAKLSHKDTNPGLWNSDPAQQGLKTYCLTHLNFKIINGQLDSIYFSTPQKKTILLGDFLRKWQIISLFDFKVCMCVCASVVLKSALKISKGGT